MPTAGRAHVSERATGVHDAQRDAVLLAQTLVVAQLARRLAHRAVPAAERPIAHVRHAGNEHHQQQTCGVDVRADTGVAAELSRCRWPDAAHTEPAARAAELARLRHGRSRGGHGGQHKSHLRNPVGHHWQLQLLLIHFYESIRFVIAVIV